MKKLLSSVIILGLCTAILSSCNIFSSRDKNTVTLNMWHNYGGDMQETMDLLIDEFNSTEGKDNGIIINVTAISSSSELNQSLDMIANGDPGAPEIPDIFTGYPKTAIKFTENNMLVNLNDYFSSDELDLYVEAFITEGKLDDGGLYVFPIAKSTEVLYLNRTLFDKFAAATGADESALATFEGIAELATDYYSYSEGKQFFSADSWFNLTEAGSAQLGSSIFDNNGLSLNNDEFSYIFNEIFTPCVQGGFAIYDGYSSDLSKTGDIVCSTGSSAGILFYGDTITYSDGTVEQVTYDILPYPVFEGGKKTALQRGGGLMVAKSTEEKEKAACTFIKWLTSPEQNIRFIAKTGYLPVTKQAFETDLPSQFESLSDIRIKKMLTSVLAMYSEYNFFTAPNYSSFDNDSSVFEKKFIDIMNKSSDKFISGDTVDSNEALSELISVFSQ